jgi:hypothetical protein
VFTLFLGFAPPPGGQNESVLSVQKSVRIRGP